MLAPQPKPLPLIHLILATGQFLLIHAIAAGSHRVNSPWIPQVRNSQPLVPHFTWDRRLPVSCLIHSCRCNQAFGQMLALAVASHLRKNISTYELAKEIF